METLIVKKVNEVYMEVDCDGGSCWELQDYFTFTVPGMQFMPAVRNKFWDGKIRLFNPQTKRIYSGLLHHVQKFCDERDYNLVVDPAYADQEFSLAEAKDHIKKLHLPFEVRDYQLDAFAHAMKKKRALMLSPTAEPDFLRKTLPSFTLIANSPADMLEVVGLLPAVKLLFSFTI